MLQSVVLRTHLGRERGRLFWKEKVVEKVGFYAHQGTMERTEENERARQTLGRDQNQFPMRATGGDSWVSSQALTASSLFYLFTNPDVITTKYRQLL